MEGVDDRDPVPPGIPVGGQPRQKRAANMYNVRIELIQRIFEVVKRRQREPVPGVKGKWNRDDFIHIIEPFRIIRPERRVELIDEIFGFQGFLEIG